MRREICYAIHRCSKFSNNYMKNHNKKKEL